MDFSAALIPALPLLGFFVLTFFGKRMGEPLSGYVGFAAVAGSFLAAVVTFFQLKSHSGEERRHTVELFQWIQSGNFDVGASLLLDPLSLTMVLFVTGVSALIHLYSVKYMHGDARFHQFFVYLNLFVFSMIMLVLADNLLLLFLGWEGVGACSYLLVGFWFERNTAATAAKKAFIVNRVGDVGLMLAMFVTFAAFGTLTFFTENGTGFLDAPTQASSGTLTAIALLLFVGAIGKSAQLPLFVWLPDAMEGPTPVSALIHAATMVTAGVYLMARAAPILSQSHEAALVVACVGALSALFAATIACAQDDIKRVLAYSTMSQLGYMFLAIGAGAYVAGLFHMVTHAFFKALLFLAAGAVIHALHDQQDLKKMGNLRKYLPWTLWLFGAGWLAISAIPPLAGFWSKDEILLAAWEYNKALYAIGALTAVLTAYYMSRLFFLAFFGKDRWKDKAVKSKTKKEEPPAAKAQLGSKTPHESPRLMLIPMVILAVLSVFGGLLLNAPVPFNHPLAHWLEPVLGAFEHHTKASTDTKWILAAVSVALSLLGIGLAYLVAKRSPLWPKSLEPKFLARAWFVDPLYSLIFEKPGYALAKVSAAFDDKVIDGAVDGSAKVIGATGGGLRRLQTGFVRSYGVSITLGAALLLVWAFVRSAS